MLARLPRLLYVQVLTLASMFIAQACEEGCYLGQTSLKVCVNEPGRNRARSISLLLVRQVKRDSRAGPSLLSDAVR
jgi:hypothetical protein